MRELFEPGLGESIKNFGTPATLNGLPLDDARVLGGDTHLMVEMITGAYVALPMGVGKNSFRAGNLVFLRMAMRFWKVRE